MTTDPVTLALLGGAAGGFGSQVVKDVWAATAGRWFSKYFGDHAPKAREKAEQNVTEFLLSLAVRIDRLEARAEHAADVARRVEAQLVDPDFSAVLKSALLSAARSSSRIKHEALARAVAERLAAEPESTEALASSIAVEAIASLSGVHLDLLRVAAIVYSIRPPGLPLPDEPPAGTEDHQTSAAEKTALNGYPDWLRTALASVPRVDEIRASDYTHLASTGCLIFERRVWLDLEAVLKPTGRRLLSLAGVGSYREQFTDFFRTDPQGLALGLLWENGLRHAILTPAGLLIGTAVHDVGTGAETRVNWGAAQAALVAPPEELEVWNGHRISREFMDELEKEIRSLASRDVGIWRYFDRR